MSCFLTSCSSSNLVAFCCLSVCVFTYFPWLLLAHTLRRTPLTRRREYRPPLLTAMTQTDRQTSQSGYYVHLRCCYYCYRLVLVWCSPPLFFCPICSEIFYFWFLYVCLFLCTLAIPLLSQELLPPRGRSGAIINDCEKKKKMKTKKIEILFVVILLLWKVRTDMPTTYSCYYTIYFVYLKTEVRLLLLHDVSVAPGHFRPYKLVLLFVVFT